MLSCRPPIDYLPYILGMKIFHSLSFAVSNIRALLFAGVVGGVVFVGLLTLLLWKLFTAVHDRREFTRFEKERTAAKWAKVQALKIRSAFV